jgi:hypothetical protein
MSRTSLPSLLLISLVLAGCGAAGTALGRLQQPQALRGQAATRGLDDAVVHAILPGPQPPRTIFEVRERLQARGGTLQTHLVANRGHENPASGSFSAFEAYTGPREGGVVREGELFIGFFTERKGDAVAVQQSFAPGLMAELIAWDYTKRRYNFWELVGTGQDSAWRYRGDSLDVLADVARLNTGGAAAPFGQRLRCSGCHTLGGPIMKELPAPHNDWWTSAKGLEVKPLRLVSKYSDDLHALTATQLFNDAKDASNLARLVKLGTDRMLAERARARGDGQDARQRLRSLFTPMEVNLASDAVPFINRITDWRGAAITLPSGFFVDERLTGPQPGPAVPADAYQDALQRAGSRFAAEDGAQAARVETRHAFLVPVRSYVDQRQLDTLVTQGLLDEELVADVLAVELTAPLYAAGRAALVRHVPAQAASVSQLRAGLVASLANDPSPAARELLANLTDPTRTAAFHRRRARAFLATCRQRQGSREALAGWLTIASQRRKEVAAAPTAQNARGTILEPGFRVVFPQDRLDAKPGQWRLRESDCGCERT